jgi:hypothetical protein
MTYETLYLRDGQYYEVTQAFDAIRVELSRGGPNPLLRLVASISDRLAGPLPRQAASQPATTLAIHMGPKAALALAEQIRELVQTMDLAPPPQGGSRV